MAIDNPVLLSFVNESIRSVADRLSGLLPIPTAMIAAVEGKGLSAILGTTDEALLRAEPWTPDDYAKVELQAITGSDSGNRSPLTNHHVIGVIRVLANLEGMKAANPTLGPLLAAVAVNPRA